ncbi:hypothetical protein RN001_011677 [Aquatica leii]|uniref:Uncharacterized protein n=1 Tax=Aquatica leii TaxID=1421715 RepID=A0AAN7Q0Y5_9COLE|nr:hypothetical protein RN001_011677 [Aquatica leii]
MFCCLFCNNFDMVSMFFKILKEKSEGRYAICGEKNKSIEEKIENLERRVEVMEREKRRKNLVIREMEGQERREERKKQLDKLFKNLLGFEKGIRDAIKLASGLILVTLDSVEVKLQILKKKGKLRRTRIFIDEDTTPVERQVQKNIRMEERKLKEEGKRTKIGFMKLWVEGEKMHWNVKENKLKRREPKKLKTKK